MTGTRLRRPAVPGLSVPRTGLPVARTGLPVARSGLSTAGTGLFVRRARLPAARSWRLTSAGWRGSARRRAAFPAGPSAAGLEPLVRAAVTTRPRLVSWPAAAVAAARTRAGPPLAA
ncbi:hypothetical protein [Phytohabitans houttuyneae]|uniref:Uncharacterized protein n=1 Tax=Phytohabitans houttuyneae TaxID=1076126 RepID=A0A6V8KSN9_9ACTN|nr:hypothetical protein [Phytohabitans houttuyneae]GFJ85668.1 hypothetical protein Phou_098480 [Phytohabitans houttuyneae]